MKPFTEILETISSIIETYDGGSYRDLAVMHRKLTCNMFYLSKNQVEFNQKWNEEYYNHQSAVNAVCERYADKAVPELYLCRKLMETAKGVSIAMGYEIRMDK